MQFTSLRQFNSQLINFEERFLFFFKRLTFFDFDFFADLLSVVVCVCVFNFKHTVVLGEGRSRVTSTLK